MFDSPFFTQKSENFFVAEPKIFFNNHYEKRLLYSVRLISCTHQMQPGRAIQQGGARLQAQPIRPFLEIDETAARSETNPKILFKNSLIFSNTYEIFRNDFWVLAKSSISNAK